MAKRATLLLVFGAAALLPLASSFAGSRYKCLPIPAVPKGVLPSPCRSPLLATFLPLPPLVISHGGIALRDDPPFSPRHEAISGTADDARTHSCLGAGCDAWARPTPAISRGCARAGLSLRATGRRQSAGRAGTLGELGFAAPISCRPLHSSVCGRSACVMVLLLSCATMCLFADFDGSGARCSQG